MRVFQHLYFIPDLYVVGGSVRDQLLGIESADIDVASPLTPDKVTELAEKHGVKVVSTGKEFGTVVLVGDGWSYEHTTFRSDHNCDGRFCEVAFTRSIEEDLARRDFTINAMAISRDGTVVDPFGGQADLEAGIIRAVGSPVTRFYEDLLRIIRAWRFAGRFGFSVDEVTDAAIRVCIEDLKREIRHPGNPKGKISVERVVGEINKAFRHQNPSFLLDQLYQHGILDLLIPEFFIASDLLQNPEYHPEGDVWSHTLQVVDRTPPNTKQRWAAFFHDIGKVVTYEWNEEKGLHSFNGHDKAGADMIEGIMRRLRLPNDYAEFAKVVARWHMYPLLNPPTKRNRRKFQANVPAHYLEQMEPVVAADVGDRWSEDIESFFIPLEDEIESVLKGRDLIAAGYTPGPHFGKMLKRAYDYQLETGCRDKATLLKVAKGGEV